MKIESEISTNERGETCIKYVFHTTAVEKPFVVADKIHRTIPIDGAGPEGWVHPEYLVGEHFGICTRDGEWKDAPSMEIHDICSQARSKFVDARRSRFAAGAIDEVVVELRPASETKAEYRPRSLAEMAPELFPGLLHHPEVSAALDAKVASGEVTEEAASALRGQA